ncbi:acetylxylan esterase [Hymenobacter sp. HSC-4F20]|uniref:alpha/beta hydrolase family protein n=1 Tax=Hymenobacter sp. HSC-4F20 TaxID=2864135 RepID=UPI001C736D2C|nr:acetylxylan esterase [Hymenobacter sp. HSC-4F20]MBX0290386.1 acetylxylan esterase [Hymenobacter sp. HSC-4F20]
MKPVLVLLAALSLLLATPAAAQKPYNVIDWKAPATLSTYLLQELHGQYDLRRAAWNQATQSAANMRAYQDSARARFRRMLGPLPARTPLKARVTGTLARNGFRIEKVIYESTPGHHVTANLYLPEGKGKRPAVLLFCGHEQESKATESYQKTAILFAQNGFVVLVIDPISQGERMQLTDAAGKSLTRGGTTEHTLLNAQAALLGRSVPAAQLWDNVRGLDYLLTRREVDAERVGCLGNSGGATQTAYFLGFDDRVKVAALCSYVAAGERNLELTGPADGCVMLPGAGQSGLDLTEYPLIFAPKPLLLLAGRYDFVDYTSMEATHQELQQAYRLLGRPEQVGMFTYDDGHGISQPKREAAVTWFRRFLLQDATPVREPNLATLSEKELWCTATGQVNTAFQNEQTLTEEYAAEAQQLERTRRALPAERLRTVVQQQLQLAAPQPVVAEAKGTAVAHGITWQKVLLRRSGEPPLPLLLALPAGTTPQKVVMLLSDGGKAALADSTALMQRYLQQQMAVVLPDLRGLGETTDPAAFNDPKYYNREYRPALLSLHGGQPLLGQRVTDILTVMEWVGSTTDLQSKPLEVHATGLSGVVALHAAVLTERISRLSLQQVPASFRDILTEPTRKDTYTWVLPGVLRRYDLPQLRQAVGQRLLAQ